MKIAILPGDGIGTEIVAQAERVLGALDLRFETETALVGGAAYEAHGHPLPESTLALAKAADAVLFGAVGDWKYDKLERSLRPEQAIALSFRDGALRFDISKPGPEDQVVEREGDPVVMVPPAISEALDGAVLDYDDAPDARRFTLEQPQPSG